MKNVYASNMLNFRDETINKSTFNTQYLFSDCALVARNYLTAFTDRFLVKLAIPDQDANKKVRIFTFVRCLFAYSYLQISIKFDDNRQTSRTCSS